MMMTAMEPMRLWSRCDRQRLHSVDLAWLRRKGFLCPGYSGNLTWSRCGTQTGNIIFAALAEFERSIIRERTLAGLAAVKARGARPGRKPSLDADDLAAAKALLRKGHLTVAEVAARLSVAPSTLYRSRSHSVSDRQGHFGGLEVGFFSRMTSDRSSLGMTRSDAMLVPGPGTRIARAKVWRHTFRRS
jgi:hypothetical protein